MFTAVGGVLGNPTSMSTSEGSAVSSFVVFSTTPIPMLMQRSLRIRSPAVRVPVAAIHDVTMDNLGCVPAWVFGTKA